VPAVVAAPGRRRWTGAEAHPAARPSRGGRRFGGAWGGAICACARGGGVGRGGGADRGNAVVKLGAPRGAGDVLAAQDDLEIKFRVSWGTTLTCLSFI
jgi:hypothetical protein